MQAAFAYKGASGDSAPWIYQEVRKAHTKRYIDPMCGSCTVPLELAASGIDLHLNDLNRYAYVNAASLFVDAHEPTLPPIDESRVGRLSSASWGYWSKAYRGYIDACLASAPQDTTLLAMVTRTLLFASFRGAAWALQGPTGTPVDVWGAKDARDHMLRAWGTIKRKRRPRPGSVVLNIDWIEAVKKAEPRAGDFVHLEPPFPWKEGIAQDIYRWYDKINDVLGEPAVPPLFTSTPTEIAGVVKYCLNRGATVMLLKQSNTFPAQKEFHELFGKPYGSLPIRGRPELPDREEYFLIR